MNVHFSEKPIMCGCVYEYMCLIRATKMRKQARIKQKQTSAHLDPLQTDIPNVADILQRFIT